MLSNRHILELGFWDGLLTKYNHVIFLMTLLILPEIRTDEQSNDQFLEHVLFQNFLTA